MSRTKCVEAHRRASNGLLTCETCRDADIAAAYRRGLEDAAKCVRRMVGRDWDSGYEEPLLDAVKQIRAIAATEP